jgi:hypothetical protein
MFIFPPFSERYPVILTLIFKAFSNAMPSITLSAVFCDDIFQLVKLGLLSDAYMVEEDKGKNFQAITEPEGMKGIDEKM